MYSDSSFEVGPFHIARFPVTYRQYKAFLDDPGGYRGETHWNGLLHEPEAGAQFRPTGNCPADNVSWYEATAFCRWLSGRLGFDVRLPYEWEWQQAAAGGKSINVYPWGEEWQDGNANTADSRLSRTTAVGMYPHGASEQDVVDLAGNVLEWCANQHENPRARKESATDDVPRVLRGGSWGFARDYARVTCRFSYHPYFRGYGFGCRVVCVSPIR